MGKAGLVITGIQAGSIADELKLQPGDRLISINGFPVRDIIDYQYLSADEKVLLSIEKQNCENWEIEIEKEFSDSLGIEFDSPVRSIKRCANKCVFCFVEQMPTGMRDTLYIKDDDYRLSFLQGNFITLTNLEKEDLDRIIEQRLSPLYISVHATGEILRRKMMRSKRAGEILKQLKYLSDNGIEMHTQIVLCPGLNDGEELKKTVSDLSEFWPQVRSIALVPVGLTRYRESLFPLKAYTPDLAREIVFWVQKIQKSFWEKYGYPLVFAADEFYLQSGLALPEYESYVDYPQVENGIGITRLFLDEWADAARSMPCSLPSARRVTLITGKLAETVMIKIASALNNVTNLFVDLVTVENDFFGRNVTVAGLLTGRDILSAVGGKELGNCLILPHVILKENENVLLDGMTLKDIESELNIPVLAAGKPCELVKHAIGG